MRRPKPRRLWSGHALLIDKAAAIGEEPEDPLSLYSVILGLWNINFAAFNGDAIRELAAQFLSLAKKQGTTTPLMIGHRLMGSSLLFTGDIVGGRAHYDQALAIYNPAEHRSLANRFSADSEVVVLNLRPLALYLLGYPDAALDEIERGVNVARDIGHAASLMHALCNTSPTLILCGRYAAVSAQSDELVPMADAKSALLWKAFGLTNQGWVLAHTGKELDAIQAITSGLAACRSTGATPGTWVLILLDLAQAHADVGQFDQAWGWVGEAMTLLEGINARLWEAELHRVAGEIALKSPEPDARERRKRISSARSRSRVHQQAKSWELRAAMSMARLWRDQGKRDEARELLAPVYGWFTEGFDTLDLKEAKALLEELAA